MKKTLILDNSLSPRERYLAKTLHGATHIVVDATKEDLEELTQSSKECECRKAQLKKDQEERANRNEKALVQSGDEGMTARDLYMRRTSK